MEQFMETAEPNQMELDWPESMAQSVAPISEEVVVTAPLESELDAVILAEAAEEANVDELRQHNDALEAQIMALQREIQGNRIRIRQKNVVVRQHRDKKWEIESAIRVRNEAIEKKAALDAKRSEFDRVSWDFKWRRGVPVGDEMFSAFQHQVDGAYFLAESTGGAILADSMGLGKTGTSLFGCDLAGAKRILIVCPGEIMSGFAKEIARWTDRPAMILGKQPKTYVRNVFQFRKAAGLDGWVDIMNYEAWARDKVLLTELESMMYDTVIVDEAHNIKETDTSAFQGVKQIVMSDNQCQSCGSPAVGAKRARAMCLGQNCSDPYNVGRSVKRVYCMTGTPILNTPGELYALLHLVDPKNFYKKTAFLNQYCQWDYQSNKYVFRPGGEASLAERLSGMYLRRTHKSAGIVLPKQDIVTHEIELDPNKYPKQTEILKTLAEHAAIQIEEGLAANTMSILALITRQRQAATWPGGIVLHEPKVDPESDIGDFIRDDQGEVIKFDIPVGLNFAESVKIDRAVELTREFVEDEQRVVVFSQFRETLSELKRRFDALGIPAAEFHGSTTTEDRERIKSNFDRSELARTGAKPLWNVVLCHYKTGGVGLNLTAATATIIMDEEWNPGKNQQAYDRTHRMGQTEQTSIHILRLANSIDAWMADLNDKKSEIISGFNSANEDAKKAAQTELANVFRKVANS